MSKRAQELAAEIYRRCTMQDDAEMRDWLEGLFEQYGREVRDVCVSFIKQEAALCEQVIQEPFPAKIFLEQKKASNKLLRYEALKLRSLADSMSKVAWLP